MAKKTLYDSNGNLTHKKCYMCRKFVPIEKFGKKETSPDGYASWCEPCRGEGAKKHIGLVTKSVSCRYCGKAITFQIMPGLVYSRHRVCKKCKERIDKPEAYECSFMRDAPMPTARPPVTKVYTKGDPEFKALAAKYKPPRGAKKRDHLAYYKGIVNPGMMI